MFTFFVYLGLNVIKLDFLTFLDCLSKKAKKNKLSFQFENHNFHKLGWVRMRIEDISAIGK